MAHLHNIYDSDIHFKLDSKTRTFSNETELKLLVAQGDHNSERITFEIPRYIEQHDMLKCNRIEVHYINISSTTRDTSKDVYTVEDAQVSPEDENIIEFSWRLSGRATRYNGTLSFAISMKCLTDEVIDYRWNTLTYEKILVGKSLNNAETIAQEYSDVLEKWKKEVLENINPTVTIDTELNEESDNAIANSTVTKKIGQLSDSKVDKQDGYSMVTDTEKEEWNNKSNFSGSYEDLADTPTIPSEYTLPIATPTTLGGVKPIAKTDEMTQEVGVDELGGLFTAPSSGGGSSAEWETIAEINWSDETILATQSIIYTGKWDKLHITSDKLVGGIASNFEISVYDDMNNGLSFIFYNICSFVAEGSVGNIVHAWIEADGNSFSYLQPAGTTSATLDRLGTVSSNQNLALSNGPITKINIWKRNLDTNQPKSGVTTIYGRKVK